MTIRLDEMEKKIRALLIGVAKGEITTHSSGLISYKELWEKCFKGEWYQGRTKSIVEHITRISAYDLSHQRPPLNEIVVKKRIGEPGENWGNIKTYLRKEFEVNVRYLSHREAQEACWHYWGRHNEKQLNEYEVEEGYNQDRTINIRQRNAAILKKRKENDDYTCQACLFRLKVGGNFIIDCHHRYPFSLSDSKVITNLEHLVCLCPTCHRIAHTKNFPLSVKEIKEILGIRSQ